jgi:hypothetical protein
LRPFVGIATNCARTDASAKEARVTTRRLFIAAAALALAACASTTIRDAWTDPAWNGPPFRKVLVLGVSRDVPERRAFEDIMAQRIAMTGVEAIPAWRYLPQSGRVDEPTLDRAVRESGADGLVMVRIRSIDRRTSVSTVMVPMHYGFGWYPWYAGWYPATDVRQYDIATVETSVFETAGKRVVWTGVTETYQPVSVAHDAPGFADIIVKALQRRGILPGTPQ